MGKGTSELEKESRTGLTKGPFVTHEDERIGLNTVYSHGCGSAGATSDSSPSTHSRHSLGAPPSAVEGLHRSLGARLWLAGTETGRTK